MWCSFAWCFLSSLVFPCFTSLVSSALTRLKICEMYRCVVQCLKSFFFLGRVYVCLCAPLHNKNSRFFCVTEIETLFSCVLKQHKSKYQMKRTKRTKCCIILCFKQVWVHATIVKHTWYWKCVSSSQSLFQMDGINKRYLSKVIKGN